MHPHFTHLMIWTIVRSRKNVHERFCSTAGLAIPGPQEPWPGLFSSSTCIAWCWRPKSGVFNDLGCGITWVSPALWDDQPVNDFGIWHIFSCRQPVSTRQGTGDLGSTLDIFFPFVGPMRVVTRCAFEFTLFANASVLLLARCKVHTTLDCCTLTYFPMNSLTDTLLSFHTVYPSPSAPHKQQC